MFCLQPKDSLKVLSPSQSAKALPVLIKTTEPKINTPNFPTVGTLKFLLIYPKIPSIILYAHQMLSTRCLMSALGSEGK